jgi:hypothetical protein
MKMEARLVHANSLLDIENRSHVDVVTGTPAAITEKVKLRRSPVISISIISALDQTSRRTVKEPKASGALIYSRYDSY